ncbi:hypothetical protein ACSVH2_02625 [Flavobacterium sp. RSB2_4_14]|uniref:hypothetical protein n=1 Tax=Flavobacterium sp. RSB2_4_14 TaxID=3447665 RepID=UPI003F31F991
MSDKNNIERLFQEKFKDFEANPADKVWGNIEAKLEEKKRKRVIPFWWKLSGVAAVFIIGFFISKAVFTENSNVNNPISTENPIVTDGNSNRQKENTINNNSTEKATGVNSSTKTSTGAVVTNSSNKNTTKQINKKGNSRTITTKTTIAVLKNEKTLSSKNKLNGKKNNTSVSVTETIPSKTESNIAENKETYSATDKTIVTTEISPNKTNSIPNSKSINLDELKNNNSIATTEIDKKANDSVIKNSVVTNALEELLNEKESKTKQESKINRWQLTSNVAPVFLGSISNGSPIDSMLVNNSKSYNTSVGFGLGVSYAVNSKLSVRTGLNKLNMSYNTNDILFFAGIESKPLKNVSPKASSAMIQVQSNVTSNNQNIANSETAMLPFENSIVSKHEGYLNQEIGYIEMPMEMTYAVVDKKFGLKVIGGFSTLFLQDNSITIVSDNGNTLLGEANNLNNIHFSTNLGVGMKYSFMKSFEFNIEPTIKYQLNTFSSNAGDFKPYIFGIYSGVSYRF